MLGENCHLQLHASTQWKYGSSAGLCVSNQLLATLRSVHNTKAPLLQIQSGATRLIMLLSHPSAIYPHYPCAVHTGEDLCFCVPNKIYSSQAYPDSAVCLRASTLTPRRVAMPPLHRRLRCCDSALAAAQGKLYLLGGSCHLEVCGCSRRWGLCLVVTPIGSLHATNRQTRNNWGASTTLC
jgi:hypothetical protein